MRIDVDESTSKTCSRCKAELPLTEFHRDKRQADGRVTRCRTCIAAYKREHAERFREQESERKRAWYAANRERVLEDQKQYREANRDAVAARQAAWREANRDRKLAYLRDYHQANRDRLVAASRAYYEAHRDEHRARAETWRLANLDKVRELGRLYSQNRRALKLGATIGEIDLDALWESQAGLCGICGDYIDRDVRWPDPMSASVDHIVPLSKGGAHAQFNLQWTHLGENSAKGARLPD